MRAGNASLLNAEVQVGHDSTGWCNLANIAFQAGTAGGNRERVDGDQGIWSGLVGEMAEHLSNHGIAISSKEISFSSMMEIDVENEKFVGDHADDANKFLKREYREPYVVPTYV